MLTDSYLKYYHQIKGRWVYSKMLKFQKICKKKKEERERNYLWRRGLSGSQVRVKSKALDKIIIQKKSRLPYL